jgi:cobalamin biosynthesis protein CobW
MSAIMAEKIPVTIITGFLGSGKTTLIRHMIAQARGRKLALIVNEFGDVGIDGNVLKTCATPDCKADDIIELANGCICCTVAENFVPTLQKLLARKQKPEHIIIETSGLALPQPLVRAFAWPEIKNKVTVDAVVTVVDAKALSEGRFADDEAALAAQRKQLGEDHENPIAELFGDQLNCADIVILNKTDLLTPEMVTMLRTDLKPKLRPGTKLVHAPHDNLALYVLLGARAASEKDMDNRLSQHEKEGVEQHDHDDFKTFTVRVGKIADKSLFLERVSRAVNAHDILRLKGVASVEGTDSRLVVQAVGSRLNAYFEGTFDNKDVRANELIVIGEKTMDSAAITKILQG